MSERDESIIGRQTVRRGPASARFERDGDDIALVVGAPGAFGRISLSSTAMRMLLEFGWRVCGQADTTPQPAADDEPRVPHREPYTPPFPKPSGDQPRVAPEWPESIRPIG